MKQTVSPVFVLCIGIAFGILQGSSGICSTTQVAQTGTVADKEPAAEIHPPPADIDILQKYGSDVSTAIPALLEGLRSPEASIRRNAAFALGEIGSDATEAIKALATALRTDTDSEVRRNAAFALGEIGPPSIPHLMACLNDKDSRVRRNVTSALVRIGTPAVSSLVTALSDDDPIVRRNAAGILGRIGPKAKEAIPALEKALDDDDKAFCWTVKQALRNIKMVSVENLIDCLNDKDPVIRNNATRALGELGEGAQSAIPALILCLNDDKAAVRQNAAFALARIGEPAIQALIESLQHENATTRRNAAFCLGEMGPQASTALPALKKLLSDPNVKTRWCADIAIKKIQGLADTNSSRDD